MIHPQTLHKRYGANTALHTLDLNLSAGELYCLLGANSAGKAATVQRSVGYPLLLALLLPWPLRRTPPRIESAAASSFAA